MPWLLSFKKTIEFFITLPEFSLIPFNTLQCSLSQPSLILFVKKCYSSLFFQKYSSELSNIIHNTSLNSLLYYFQLELFPNPTSSGERFHKPNMKQCLYIHQICTSLHKPYFRSVTSDVLKVTRVHRPSYLFAFTSHSHPTRRFTTIAFGIRSAPRLKLFTLTNHDVLTWLCIVQCALIESSRTICTNRRIFNPS